MTDALHDAGGSARHGTFRQRTTRTRLDALFNVPAAARLYS